MQEGKERRPGQEARQAWRLRPLAGDQKFLKSKEKYLIKEKN